MRLLLAVGAWLLCVPPQGHAQHGVGLAPSAPFSPSPQTAGLRPILSLGTRWQGPKGAEWNAPFVLRTTGTYAAEHDFFLARPPTDTLYIYFHSLGPAAEVQVNEKLLALATQPFAPLLVAVPPAVLHAQWNRLRLVLGPTAQAQGFLPADPLAGVAGPVHLLAPSAVAKRWAAADTLLYKVWAAADSLTEALAHLSVKQQADTTVIYLLYTPGQGFGIPAEQLDADFTQIRMLGARFVCFPIPPTAQVLALLAANGLGLSRQPGKWAALWQAGKLSANLELPVWTNSGGVQTPAIQTYASTQARLPELPPRGLVLAQLLVALVLLVALKLEAPIAFAHFLLKFGGLAALLQPTRDPAKLGMGANVGFFLLLVLAQTAVLHLFISLINFTGQAHNLNILSSDSLLHALAQPALQPTPVLWLKAFALVVGFLLYKTMLTTFAQQVFSLRSFRADMSQAELEGAIPTWLALWLVLVVPALGNPQALQAAMAAAWVLVPAALALHILVVALHLRQNPQIHPAGKLLYICGAEILPLVILF